MAGCLHRKYSSLLFLEQIVKSIKVFKLVILFFLQLQPNVFTEVLTKSWAIFFQRQFKNLLLCDLSHGQNSKFLFRSTFEPKGTNATTLMLTNAVIIVLLVALWIENLLNGK